jgi:hypothetical protein
MLLLLLLLLPTSLLHLGAALSSPASCLMIDPERPAERDEGQHRHFARQNNHFAMLLESSC